MKVAMLKTLRVKDVMTEALVTLRADSSIEEAWESLHEAGVTGAPVLNEKGRVVGVLSNYDLADPRRRSQPGVATVGDVMTRVAYGVRADDPAFTAVRLMIDENIHRVLVVNDDGLLEGIVVPMDLLRSIAESFDDTRVEYFDLRKLHEG